MTPLRQYAKNVWRLVGLPNAIFPVVEFNPNERAHWLEFRQAYEAYRARWG